MGEKRKAEVEAPASSSRPRLSEEESLGPDLASLEGLRAIRALPDLCGGRALAAASRGWFWRVKDSLLGGIVSRLRGTQSVLRQRASRLELWEIEALLPQMETSVKDFCELWCQLRNRLEMELRTNCWRRLAQELAPGVAELELCQVETQSFTMPAVSVLPPPPHGPPPPPPATAAAPFQGPVTMPLLGNVTAAFPAVGPAAANATIPAGPLPTVNMPGTLPGPLLGAAVLPLNGAPMGLPPAGAAGAAAPGPAPPAVAATAIASTAQQVAGVVNQLIHQVMQGPAGGGAGAAPASAPGVREMMRMNIVRVLQFSLGDHRVAGRFHLVYEAEGREGMEARARPDILCIEVELSVEEGKFKPLATAKRMAQEGRLGPWSCTERREVERRWVEMRAKALGVLGLSLELSQFMRLMAGLLGAALLEEPVPNRRLWNALKPLIAGPSPMARLRIGLGGMGVTTFHDLERDAGAAGAAPGAALGAAGPSSPSNRGTPLGPGELLSHPPFAEYV